MATRKPIAVDAGELREVSPASDTLDAKLQVGATTRLLGRSTAGAGAHEEITVGAGLSLAGGALTATGGGGGGITAYQARKLAHLVGD